MYLLYITCEVVCQQQASKRAAGIIKILQSPRPLVAVIVHQSPYKTSAIASWWR